MQSIPERLQMLIEHIVLANHSKHWSKLADLDKQANALIAETMNEKMPDQRTKELLNELQIVYQQIIADCRQERGTLQKSILDSLNRQDKLKEYQGRL